MKLMTKFWIVTAFAVSVLGVSARPTFAQTAPSAPPPAQTSPQVPDTYMLGPEDILTIVIRDVPESSGDFLVRLDGKITFPIVGEIMVAGKTAGALRKELEKGLSKELRDPSVTVNVRQMRINRIYILGAVLRPSVYDYRPGWRLTELVAAASGLNAPAERCHAIVFRANEPTRTISMKDVFVLAKPEANIELQQGDVVNIQPDVTVRVNVIGDVRQSGQHDVYEGQGAVEALAASGGGQQDTAYSKAKIVRRGTEMPVDLYSAVVLGQSDKNIVLEDGDTLYIPTIVEHVSVVGFVNRPGTQLMPDGRAWTLSQAISEAGGPAPGSKLDGITIQRYDENGSVKPIFVNYRKLGSKPGQTDIPLRDKDVVYVAQSGATNINQLGTIGNLYFILKAIFHF